MHGQGNVGGNVVRHPQKLTARQKFALKLRQLAQRRPTWAAGTSLLVGIVLTIVFAQPVLLGVTAVVVSICLMWLVPDTSLTLPSYVWNAKNELVETTHIGDNISHFDFRRFTVRLALVVGFMMFSLLFGGIPTGILCAVSVCILIARYAFSGKLPGGKVHKKL